MMELLIADSGSTKTDWIFIRDGKETAFHTEGLNPWQTSEEAFATILKNVIYPAVGGFSGTIFFYGAGCGTPEKQNAWKRVILDYLPKAKVEVNSDLLGAARSLCGNKPGIAVILGTGSNSCMYDGEKITESQPSLGYLFGDEGSGVHIGKLFLTRYLSDELGAELRLKFESETGMDRQKILEGTYRQPRPNRFLASFARFVINNKEQELCNGILRESFEAFTAKHLLHYDVKNFTVHVTGSVGIHCREMLEEIWKRSGIRAGKFVERPVEGMKEYHLGK